MPAGAEEVFSNPLAPPGEAIIDDRPQRLTNADFRKLLMTPRAPPGTQKETVASTGTKTPGGTEPPTQRRESKDDARAAERKKKKSYYAKIKKEEEEKMAELAEKYRDRAKERREGKNPDYQAEDPSQAGMGGYRAVAPDLKSGLDAAERRKQMIQESKFLGGDMEHTHLVKGLDYALLQKVRSEIQLKESEIILEMDRPGVEPPKEKKPAPPPPVVVQEEDELVFKTNQGRRIFNSVFNTKPAEFNDLFLTGRMAYAIDLDDDMAESDIPTTVIRSKADLQGIENMQATFTTNDIVIQKLTQILSYLRTGRANKKQKKKDKGKNESANRAAADDSIYGEIGEYVPSVGKANDREKDRGDRERDRHQGRDRDRDRERGDRRDRDKERGERDRDREKDRRDRDRDRDRERERHERDREHDRERKPRSYFSRSAHEEVKNELRAAEERLQAQWPTGADIKMDKQASQLPQIAPQLPQGQQQQQQPQQPQQPIPPQHGQQPSKPVSSLLVGNDYYTECYPGMAEMQDAIDDSDDEADYTKMDMGNKKGPVGRWDFDTQEEYSDYMNQREAMPKAAFQYGVKMADGRKTRRIGGNKEKDRNAELNREWQQIQQILKRRKDTDGGGGPEKAARYDY
ncbi:protein Red-like isoform X2 [Eriocheir sinensis]|uniref:protein Red-like isoform X2 n=1 Tax=Eriocheir sinensis TaxID=95602 RepID=UPI0021C65EEA|nr:protein Red-like isoform X2 [Eriocheir sinensis]